MRYRVEPFVPQDYVDVCRQIGAENLPPYLDAPAISAQLRRDGPAFTLWDETHRLGCGGVQVAGQRGHAWLMLGPDAHRHPIPLVRTILRQLPRIVEVHRLGRMQADVLEGHEAGVKLILALGFTEECVMRRYGEAGEDMRRYVSFPGE
jgi:hypothetical protein